MLPRQGRRDSRGRAHPGRGDSDMKPRTHVHWLQLKVGLVILFAIAGVLVAIMNLNEGMGLFARQVTFHALVGDSHGIKVGAPVRLNGVDTGNIIHISIDSTSGKVALTFTVNNNVLPLLRRDAAVLIRPMGLLGDKYLELLPGNPKEPPLKDDAVLTGQAESDITGLAESATETLENVNRGLRDFQTILTSLKDGKGTAGKLVSDPALYDHTMALLRKAEDISDKTTQLLAKIEHGEGTLGRLVTDRAFYDRAAATVVELQKVATLLNQPNGSLGRLARDPSLYMRLQSLTAKGEALVGKIERGDGTLGKLVTQDQLYQRADKVLTEMETLLADVKKNPTKYFKFSVF
ncbi:MAG: MCE family protein [Nitrospirae bacterium]|nr:MAG: MCE family protein [Nitrospirota bacterium]